MDAKQIIDRCLQVAACTEEPGHITRTFLSPPMHEVHRLVGGWMEEAGLRVRVDAAGNLRGVRGEGPRLLMGSHLDTVPRGGAYDGVLGVLIAIAVAADQPSCAVEVAGFSEEEGVRFGVPFIGSRALAGSPVTDPEILHAIRAFRLDASRLHEAILNDHVRGYLEFHIEQGPVLESQGLPLGVVDTIAGQSRWELRFHGRAAHAGTTPMNQRRDALACAAEWVGLVEHVARATEGLVATVGRLDVLPGAGNVIAGEVRATLDVRHPLDEVRERATETLLDGAEHIADGRSLTAEADLRLDQPAVAMNLSALEQAVADAGYPVYRLVSGAGHDAMILARRIPSAMLFLRSPGGISHNPQESVLPEDVAAALAVGSRFLENWRPQ